MKEEHKVGYTIFRGILGKVLFNIWYRPKIINKEVIPKDGPIIVCGNHINVFDQNLACLSTKRMLHYMAKKEYFDKKTIAWFFKLAGCIPVNRQIHDETAKNHALEVLKNGNALGIFPEGTRNQLSCRNERIDKLYPLFENEYSKKEFIKKLKANNILTSQINKLEELLEQKEITEEEFKDNFFEVDAFLESKLSKTEYKKTLLLPIKFGTVSMAQKTGALIVPYAITGKYKMFNNHLNIKFGTPFKVKETDDLEKANKKLFDTILNLKLEGIDAIKRGER